jgi:reactive intermediate/imine deaminase
MRIPLLLFLWMFAAWMMPASASDAPPGVAFYPQADESMADLPFSEAVRAGGLLFLSGQVGVEPDTGELVEGGIRPEARRTMKNILATLERHGHEMKDVVKCTVMLADIDEWPDFNEVYVTFFDEPYPARSAFAASGLALDARVEVECIAAAPGTGQ